MKICISGGCGFIGSHLVDKLIELNHEVVIIDNLSTGNINNLNPKAKFYPEDITNDLKEIFELEQFDQVFHLAAQINLRHSIKNPYNDANINIMGSLNLLENCVKYKVKKFVFSSTGGAIYDPNEELPCNSKTSKVNPTSPYGTSKYCIEKYLQLFKDLYGLDFCALRYSNIYGGRQADKSEAGVISIFINKLLNDEDIVIFGTGNQSRDFLHYQDVINANITCLYGDNFNLSGIYNVSSGTETSINQIASILMEKMNKKVNIVYAPPIKGELLRSCLESDFVSYVSLDEGLEKTIEWFKEQRK